MNNKGQSLVLFILIIPILLGIVVLVIDVGNAIYEKNKINSTIEMIIEYGLEDNYNKEQLEELINYNLNNNNYSVNIDNKVINISVNTYIDGIISNVINIDGFKIISEYNGYIENNKKVIEKVK